ncbi:hypothetical protein, partial [Providencia stuartii]|uniref:hypothetical protein n=1 Tax=Providencia stuartii TaxID=588 RepID=UPI001954B9E7
SDKSSIALAMGSVKDRGGALAPLDGNQPRPVLQAALPTAVGEAAFRLKNGGLTDVIESGLE